MKIRFAKAIVASLAFNLLSAVSFSQEASSPGVSTGTSTSASFSTGNSNASQYKITASEVTGKAIKTFGDYFNDVADVIWWHQGKEYMAEFRKDGKWVKAYFTSKGNFISSFAITTEDHLPEDIRSQIKMVYHRY